LVTLRLSFQLGSLRDEAVAFKMVLSNSLLGVIALNMPLTLDIASAELFRSLLSSLGLLVGEEELMPTRCTRKISK
jgi:hypothetical protein